MTKGKLYALCLACTKGDIICLTYTMMLLSLLHLTITIVTHSRLVVTDQLTLLNLEMTLQLDDHYAPP